MPFSRGQIEIVATNDDPSKYQKPHEPLVLDNNYRIKGFSDVLNSKLSADDKPVKNVGSGSHRKKGEETYVNGILDGLVTVWHENGNKDREGIIRGNEPEGSWTYYFADGKEDFRFDYGSGLDRVRIAELEERDGTFYKIGKHKPYSGIVVESGGLKDLMILLFIQFKL